MRHEFCYLLRMCEGTSEAHSVAFLHLLLTGLARPVFFYFPYLIHLIRISLISSYSRAWNTRVDFIKTVEHDRNFVKCSELHSLLDTSVLTVRVADELAVRLRNEAKRRKLLLNDY